MHRRTFLSLALVSACTRRATSAPRDALEPTRHIDDDDELPPVCGPDPTAANIEGPFYRRGAPHRSVLAVPSDAGERLRLVGSVLTTRCEPISGATIDVWQADTAGAYDNDSKRYRFRGVMTTDASGRYDLRTIVPGRYLNGDRYRPAHIHIKVRASGHRVLTTQLYFAGDPYNDGDPFIDSSLIMAHEQRDGITRARFDFVLA